MASYQETINEFAKHFDEIGVCNYKSNIHSDYIRTTPSLSPQDTQPYAVVMSTGICEMHKIQIQNFRALVSTVVQFVHESCTGLLQADTIPVQSEVDSHSSSNQGFNHATHSTEHSDTHSGKPTTGAEVKNANLFLFKLEEAIDIKIVIAQPLYEANDYLYHHVIPALNRNLPLHAQIPVLDTHHISRAWKIHNDAVDGWHYYGDGYRGDTASHAIVSLILTKFVDQMKRNLNAIYCASMDASVAVRSASSDSVYDPYSEKILSTHSGSGMSTSVNTGTGRETTGSDSTNSDNGGYDIPTFPAVDALPYVYRMAQVEFEGNLLYNPYNKREIFIVHEGMCM